jgi:hypothetical protein
MGLWAPATLFPHAASSATAKRTNGVILNVAALSYEDKITEMLKRSPKYMGTEAAQLFQTLISRENLTITVLTLLLWAIAHVYGVGEATDVVLLVVGVGFVGWGFWGGLRDAVDGAAGAIGARHDGDLENAAKLFGRGAVTMGINTLVALLMRKPLTTMGSRVGRLTVRNMRAGSSMPAAAADAVKTLAGRMNWKPYLRPIPPPPAGELSFEIVEPSEINGYAGKTDPYGNIKMARGVFSSYREQLEATYHELGHRWLSPHAQILRQFRATLAANAYERSVFLRYMEEAGVQTNAILRTTADIDGVGSIRLADVLRGVRFPVEDGARYAVLRRISTMRALVPTHMSMQGWMVGTVVVDGEMFGVYICARGQDEHGKK